MSGSPAAAFLEDPDDLCHANAVASLPLMTPQRLRHLLHRRAASDVWDEIVRGVPAVRDRLAEMSSFTGGVLNSRPSGHTVHLTASDISRTWRDHARKLDARGLWTNLANRDIRVVRFGQAAYPRRLLHDEQAPELLYVTGEVSVADGPAAAIVGTRRATHYGSDVASELGAELARAGVCIVSGLAAGIDAAAHEGALAGCESSARCPGRPLGVLGGGVDVYYPVRNRRLIDRVRLAGAVISEAPPGENPDPWRFPLRNRIIAALAQAVVVVESARSGGALHTVEAALVRDRDVFAVPGSVRSPASVGTNELLSSGAHVARDASDVLTALVSRCVAEGIEPPQPPAEAASTSPGGRRALKSGEVASLLGRCGADERRVYNCLEERTLTVDTICERAGMGVGGVILALAELREAGLAAPAEGGWRRR